MTANYIKKKSSCVICNCQFGAKTKQKQCYQADTNIVYLYLLTVGISKHHGITGFLFLLTHISNLHL